MEKFTIEEINVNEIAVIEEGNAPIILLGEVCGGVCAGAVCGSGCGGFICAG